MDLRLQQAPQGAATGEEVPALRPNGDVSG